MTKTTKAEITLTNGNAKIRVDTVIRHDCLQAIFRHLIGTLDDIEFNGSWRMENIFFSEEYKL